MSKGKPQVGLLMGSDSDWPSLERVVTTLSEFGVECEVSVLSAHRTPKEAAKYAETARSRGLKVIIAAAGGAAHLAGVIAGHTILPVVGIPLSGGALNGMDSLLATLQMPAGIPVATVTLGSAGPVNAAILAVQILAVSEAGLAAKLLKYKKSLKSKVQSGNRRVAGELAKIKRTAK